MKALLPHLAVLAATVFWASSFAAGKAGVLAMPAAEVLAIRFVIGTAILMVAARAFGLSLRFTAASRNAALVGMLSPGFATMVVYWAMLHTSSVNALVVTAWMPIVASIAARLLIKEPISPAVVAGALVALAGIGLLVSDDAPAATGSLFGDALCVLSLVVMATMTVALRVLTRGTSPLLVATWQLSGATIFATVITFAVESWADSRGVMAVPSLEVWALILYLAVFVSAATYALNNYGLRHIPVGRTALYSTLMVPLGAPISAVWFDEAITRSDLAAIVLVMAGVALPALASLRRRSRAAAGRTAAP